LTGWAPLAQPTSIGPLSLTAGKLSVSTGG
jgi:hypothetical protein